ncbi:hypothetical protein M408DRAFT_79787 [Serendipita vermifera MAFF 305830]|uniref:Peptidase A1 domain-containing protein n=1 Tax=Serendipita vermifera MAFF 305830 TaxID=933852 RepID=A0A0C3ARP4_SERVB|nr:hypothetical protein M408DRAFT_79787 [Serendipita vermifera MAFF 305830]
MHVVLQALASLCLVETAVRATISNTNGGHSKKLFRRDEYIDGTGYSNQNTSSINIPLNNNASSQQAWRDPSKIESVVRIPHTSLVATAFSFGGGPNQTFNGGTFSGRTLGGGTRNEIYGTARYGSGYGKYTSSAGGTMQYQSVLTLDVSGRDFPHGFPPLSFGNYSGGGEYYDVDSSDLPGILESHSYNTAVLGQPELPVYTLYVRTSNRSWFVVGDVASLNIVNAVISLPVDQGGCNLVGLIPHAIERYGYGYHNNNTTNEDSDTSGYNVGSVATEQGIMQAAIFPWNVVQFYRGSSLALTMLEYDNAFAHNGNKNTDYWASTPLNTTGLDMNFLTCLNQTIAASIPIVDPTLVVRSRLSGSQIAGIVIGPIAGALLFAIGLRFWYNRKGQGIKDYSPEPISLR